MPFGVSLSKKESLIFTESPFLHAPPLSHFHRKRKNKTIIKTKFLHIEQKYATFAT